MADVPTTEPRYLTAGDTWTWQRSLSDYSAADGWTLTYALVTSAAQITITASASGSDHLVEVDAATTAAYTPGDYSWQAYVTSGAERYQVDTGTVTVRPNLAAASSGYDTRSGAEIILDAINTYLQTGDIQAGSVSFEGRQIQYHSLEDLLKARSLLSAEVANEAAKKRAQELGIDPRRYKIRLGYH